MWREDVGQTLIHSSHEAAMAVNRVVYAMERTSRIHAKVWRVASRRNAVQVPWSGCLKYEKAAQTRSPVGEEYGEPDSALICVIMHFLAAYYLVGAAFFTRISTQ